MTSRAIARVWSCATCGPGAPSNSFRRLLRRLIPIRTPPWVAAPKNIIGADFLYAHYALAIKSDPRARSPTRFLRATKALVYSYVLASVQDPDAHQRRNLSSAFAWLGPIETAFFIGIRSQDTLFAKIDEEDSARRRGWIPISLRFPPLSLYGVMYESPNQFRDAMPSEFVPKTAESKFANKRVATDKGGAGKVIRKDESTPTAMEAVRRLFIRRVVLVVLSMAFGANRVKESTLMPVWAR